MGFPFEVLYCSRNCLPSLVLRYFLNSSSVISSGSETLDKMIDIPDQYYAKEYTKPSRSSWLELTIEYNLQI